MNGGDEDWLIEGLEGVPEKIKNLQNDDFLAIDSILIVKLDNSFDIVYDETIIIKLSAADAIWYDKSVSDLANELTVLIKESIIESKKENTFYKRMQRLGLALLVLALLVLTSSAFAQDNQVCLT